MVHIHFQSAEDIASEMGYASQTIGQATNKTYDKAAKTTLSVNRKAQVRHEDLIKLTSAFNASFEQTIAQLHSVKTEFQRTDIELHDNMNQIFSFSNPFQYYSK